MSSDAVSRPGPGAVLILLAALCLPVSCGDEGADETAAPAELRAWLVEVHLEASDDLSSLSWRLPGAEGGAASLWIREEEEEKVLVVPDLETLLPLVDGGSGISAGPGVDELADIETVVVVTVEFAGRGRHGSLREVRLLGAAEGGFERELPDELVLGPVTRGTELTRATPFPDGMRFRIDEGGLELTAGGESRTLRAGDEAGPLEASREIRVRVAEFEPIPMDEMDADPFPKPVLADLGAVSFRSSIRILYHGRVRVEGE